MQRRQSFIKLALSKALVAFPIGGFKSYNILKLHAEFELCKRIQEAWQHLASFGDHIWFMSFLALLLEQLEVQSIPKSLR